MTARMNRAQPPLDDQPARGGSGSVEKTTSSGLGASPRLIGRYALFDEIASGGMGAVYFGRQVGSAGFERVVAVKRAHQVMARDAEFIAMFREEIRLLSRIRHQNVVPALDVVEDDGELLLIMEYVHGQALSTLTRRARELERAIPLELCVAVACGVLQGLHAVHTAESSTGQALGIVHRDVSPQNVLVGCDGLARVLDFGVAKAANSGDVTRIGHVKGKLGYIAPEHILGKSIDSRADIYGLSVVLWEMLASTRLFAGKKDSDAIEEALAGKVPRLSAVAARRVPPALEEIVRRGLATDPARRFSSARDMASALQAAVSAASAQDVGDWVTELAHSRLVERSRQLAWAENCPLDTPVMPAEGEPVIETTAYSGLLDDDPHEMTVRDAHFEHALLGLETEPGAAGERDGSNETATHFMLRPDTARTKQAAEPVTRVIPPLTAQAAAPSAWPPPSEGARDERRQETQPGKRVAARSDRIRRGVLYVAAFAAAASLANSLTGGALAASLHHYATPVTVAQVAPSSTVIPAAPVDAAPVEAMPSAPVVVASPNPIERPPASAVPLSSLALERPAKAASAPATVSRVAPVPAKASAPRTAQRPAPVQVLAPRKLGPDGF